MGTPISPTIAELIKRRDQLQVLIDDRLVMHRQANENEAELESEFKKAWSRAFLRADGSVRERECRADLETEALHRRLLDARALRRSASECLKAWESDIDCITALAHLANRELRVLGA